jgi:hypothetical protein
MDAGGFGNPRYGRFGNLRYGDKCAHLKFFWRGRPERIGAKTFSSASDELRRSADKNVRAPEEAKMRPSASSGFSKGLHFPRAPIKLAA